MATLAAMALKLASLRQNILVVQGSKIKAGFPIELGMTNKIIFL
ncbi:MAG: hypothetical protein Q8R86_03265 [Sulfuricurvum sp.]|nr:hypothetical protein [Sulfuricurvum sp.]